MTIAAVRKFEPASDGFFDLDYGARRGALARARAAGAAARAERAADHLRAAVEAPGVYALSRADAADLNRMVDLPEQPNYDWSDVRDMSDEEE